MNVVVGKTIAPEIAMTAGKIGVAGRSRYSAATEVSCTANMRSAKVSRAANVSAAETRAAKMAAAQMTATEMTTAEMTATEMAAASEMAPPSEMAATTAEMAAAATMPAASAAVASVSGARKRNREYYYGQQIEF
jgi:hypothetical protein